MGVGSAGPREGQIGSQAGSAADGSADSTADSAADSSGGAGKAAATSFASHLLKDALADVRVRQLVPILAYHLSHCGRQRLGLTPAHAQPLKAPHLRVGQTWLAALPWQLAAAGMHVAVAPATNDSYQVHRVK